MISNFQLRECIIKPVLDALQIWSSEAEELLVGTLAHESEGGFYLKQLLGPALGLYQMERVAHDYLWSIYLPNNPKLASGLMTVCRFSMMPKFEDLMHNLFYSTAMAIIYYQSKNAPIPKDLQGQAEYWKKHWNTEKGAGTIDKYLNAYEWFNHMTRRAKTQEKQGVIEQAFINKKVIKKVKKNV